MNLKKKQRTFLTNLLYLKWSSNISAFVSSVGDAAIDQLREEKEFAEGQVKLFSIFGNAFRILYV